MTRRRTELEKRIAQIRRHDPVRAAFIEELREMVDLWQDEHNQLADDLEKIKEILEHGYGLLEALRD